MGDGRFKDERIRHAVRELSHRHVLTDLGRIAERAGTVLSSVLLGAVAGSEALPIPRERLRAAIERAGIAVEANLRGFESGCRLFDEETKDLPESGAADVASGRDSGASPAALPDSLASRLNALPDAVREIARLGAERTVDFQDVRYGALYLERIERVLARNGSGRSCAGRRRARRRPRSRPRSRPPSRPVDVLRGHHPGCGPQDPALAHRAGAVRSARDARAAGSHHRVSQTRCGRVVLPPPRVAGAADPAFSGTRRVAPPPQRRAACSDELRDRLSPAVDARPAQAIPARHAPLPGGAGANRDVGCRRSARRMHRAPPSPSKRRSARTSSRDTARRMNGACETSSARWRVLPTARAPPVPPPVLEPCAKRRSPTPRVENSAKR